MLNSSDMTLHWGELAQPSEALLASAPAFLSLTEAFCKNPLLLREMHQ